MKKLSKFFNGIIGTIIIYLALYYGGAVLISKVLTYVDTSGLSDGWNSLMVNYFPVGVLGLIFALFMALFDKASFKTMLPGYGNNGAKSAIGGLLAGLVCNGGLIIIALLTGHIRLAYSGMGIGFAICAILIVSFQCIAEEVMDRIFLYQRFKNAKGHTLAIILSAVFFSAMHIPNMIIFHAGTLTTILGLLNIVLIGIFFAETVHYGNTTWFAFGFHSAWNFCQNFICGLPNSGLPASASVLKTVFESDGLTYDTVFGIEASVTSVALSAILIAVTIYMGRKKEKN